MADSSEPLGELIRASAVVAMTNSLDHLLAWATLYLRGKLAPTFAHMTLLRGAVEGASTARWLVEPAVARRVRIAGGTGAELVDLAEVNKIQRLPRRTAAPPRTSGRPAAARIRELEDAAAATGICPLRIGHTDAVARYGAGEFSYRLLCAFAHGGTAIPLAMSLLDVSKTDDADTLRSGLMEADDQVALDMTEIVMRTVLTALREVYAYHGRAFDDTPPRQGAKTT
jgi:hypothetical protein